jgi:hypothetical protein
VVTDDEDFGRGDAGIKRKFGDGIEEVVPEFGHAAYVRFHERRVGTAAAEIGERDRDVSVEREPIDQARLVRRPQPFCFLGDHRRKIGVAYTFEGAAAQPRRFP